MRNIHIMKKLILSLIIFASTVITANQAQAIMGGAAPNNYYQLPLVGILIDRAATNKQNICAGTLINANTVLTAAHCFENASSITNRTLVRAADLDATNAITQQISKSQIYIHPNYSGLYYDLAVIKLTQPLPGLEAVFYPIVASSTNFEYFYFMGYGTDERNNQGPLKRVYKHKNKILRGDQDEQHLIIFDQTDLQGISGGDSGGPVITSDGTNAFLIAVNKGGTTLPNGTQGSSKGKVTKLTPAIIDWIKSLTPGLVVDSRVNQDSLASANLQNGVNKPLGAQCNSSSECTGTLLCAMASDSSMQCMTRNAADRVSIPRSNPPLKIKEGKKTLGARCRGSQECSGTLLCAKDRDSTMQCMSSESAFMANATGAQPIVQPAAQPSDPGAGYDPRAASKGNRP